MNHYEAGGGTVSKEELKRMLKTVQKRLHHRKPLAPKHRQKFERREGELLALIQKWGAERGPKTKET